MTNELAPRSGDIEAVIDMVVNGLLSEHSRRAYGKALVDFLSWWEDQKRPALTKAIINRYRAFLQDQEYSPATINQHMSAVRKLIGEAIDNGMLDPHLGAGILKVKGVKTAGVRSGNWLTINQVRELLDSALSSPDNTRLKRLRDRAILAVMIGSGIRRSEVAALEDRHIQTRDGRPIITDLVGKGNRVRTIPIPEWVRLAIDDWRQAANISAGRVFRPINKGGKLSGKMLTPQAIYYIIRDYSLELGIEVAPHDLRRTFAKLAHRGGAGIDQIQLSLGHASIQTTERYLGVQQDLTDAPCDHLGIEDNK
jgi:site-specific recombinase XerD